MAQRVEKRRAAESGFEAWVQARVAQRGAFAFLVLSVLMLAMTAGLVARLTNPDDFGSYGDGIWWAMATLTTVGYGDVVPTSTNGRVLGGFVMLLGVTFISFLTANVTSLYIRSHEDDRADELIAALSAIDARLAAIESRLSAGQ